MNHTAIYWANVLICISVIIFCGVKVMLDPRPETTSIYLPIMSGIVGYFVPSPLKKKEEKLITPQTNNNTNSITSNYSNQQTPPLSPTTINIDIPNRINNI